MKYIGNQLYYKLADGTIRKAKCCGIEYHDGLHTWLFKCVSAYGNSVNLTKKEIMGVK